MHATLALASNPSVAAWSAARLSGLWTARDGNGSKTDGGVDRRRWMDVQQRQVGEFRIYAGALDAPEGGYTAAVEVHRVSDGGDAPEVVFSSERVSGGHRFEVAALALRHALDIGHQAIRLRESLGA